MKIQQTANRDQKLCAMKCFFSGNSVKWTESHVTSSSLASKKFFDAHVISVIFFVSVHRFVHSVVLYLNKKNTVKTTNSNSLCHKWPVFFSFCFSLTRSTLILMLLGPIFEMNPCCLFTNIPIQCDVNKMCII